MHSSTGHVVIMEIDKLISTSDTEINKRRSRKRRRRRSTSYLKLQYKRTKINNKVESLKDLIDFAWLVDETYSNVIKRWFVLWDLIPEMTQLNNMIGMESLKNEVVHTIMYYVQNMHYYTNSDGVTVRSNSDSLHTVIMGAPGTGKTEVANILAKIYSKLGVLSSSEVIHLKLTDLIGKYVGHTEHKTTEMMESAKGKVLFLDEGYSIGSSNKNTTSYSEAAINIINEYLERNKHEFIFMIAGYKESLERSFFSVNPGLKRRFRITYTINEYSGEELYRIFLKVVRENHWMLNKDAVNKSFFEKNKPSFVYFGGDINILFDKCTKIHTKRIFGTTFTPKLLTKEDIEKGYELFLKHRETKENSNSYIGMYS